MLTDMHVACCSRCDRCSGSKAVGKDSCEFSDGSGAPVGAMMLLGTRTNKKCTTMALCVLMAAVVMANEKHFTQMTWADYLQGTMIPPKETSEGFGGNSSTPLTKEVEFKSLLCGMDDATQCCDAISAGERCARAGRDLCSGRGLCAEGALHDGAGLCAEGVLRRGPEVRRSGEVRGAVDGRALCSAGVQVPGSEDRDDPSGRA